MASQTQFAAYCIASAICLGFWAGAARSQVVSPSGFTYFHDAVTHQWCVTDSADTAVVDTTTIFVQIVEDSVLTEGRLDLQGFSTTNVIADFGHQLYLVSVPDPGVVFDHLDSLESWELVERAWLNMRVNYYIKTNDPLLVSQYQFANDTTEVYSAWHLQRELPDYVQVLFLDSGCDTEHEELTLVTGQSVGSADWTNDIEEHGTATMSVVAAYRDNNLGIAGVAGNYPSDSIQHFRMFGMGSDPVISTVVQGLQDVKQYVLDNIEYQRRYVLNLSIGFSDIGGLGETYAYLAPMRQN